MTITDATPPDPVAQEASEPDGGGDRFAVSYAQQRLWLLERLLPCSGVYNSGQVLRLAGELNEAALSRALAEVVRRHESLRTHFVLEDGVPVQMIAPAVTFEVAAEEVVGATEQARTAAALALAQAEAQAGFDLARGPLWRVRLWRLAPQEHWLQLTLHHIVTDGWSMGVLVRELSLLYAAYREGSASPLPPLPVQYADYAVWQRQWLQGEVLERQLRYWREALAEVPVLELPSDRRRPPVSSYRGGWVAFAVPAALTGALKQLSRREGATLFMTLLAAFQVLLSRYSGQEDVAVGVPTAGRSRPEVEGLIGFFVNMLVLRGDLRGAPAFTAYLAQVRERALAAYAHQDMPFERLVEELAPARDLSRNPLFQVSLVLHNTPAAQWQLPGLTVTRVEAVGSASAKFDLTLALTERDGALGGRFEYASDLFDAATIERMAGHFRVLLEAVVATPEASIARLPLLPAEERSQLLALGTGPVVAQPAACVHDGFAAQAARTPEAVAVMMGSEVLTYRELDRQANRLAHHLRGLGVAADVPVALCLARSFELVVAMLAVLKAGGAYLPLDPDYPAERVALMLDDAQAPVLLTQAALQPKLPRYAGRVVCVDRDAGAWAACPEHAPASATTPVHLAYVIYTSGSTGRPKGVMVSHENVVGLARQPNYVKLTPRDTIGHASNVAFDAATFEVWGALLNGARLAVLSRDDMLSASALARAIERGRITCLFLTTALFNAIAASDPHAFGGLRCLLFGGEAHDPHRVGEVLRATPPRHLVHVYGPTETTTFATFHEVQADDSGKPIPIGRPVSGAVIVIVDSHGMLVPQGVIGEICVGGSGVARGYLNRPQETAERFVGHPLATDSDHRVFKSGDLARWNAAGRIEYAGRNDEQVKIRGFRIEPAEIAAAIRLHPSIRACHVMIRRQPSGDTGVTAYFVSAEGDAGMTPLALQRHVASLLPAFMVPATCVAVDDLPVTANGKVDHRALPDPAIAPRMPESAHALPRDDIERALCTIWKEALGVNQVGIDDDFFALGGHSLLAARIFSRIDAELRCSLPLGVLFESPTVRALAERLRMSRGTDAFMSLVVMARGGRQPPLYLIPGVFGNIVGFAALARRLGADRPVYGLQSVGLDGLRPPLASIEEIAQRFLREVRRAQPDGPYAFAGACFGATVAYEMARQAMAIGETIAYLGLLDPTSRESVDDSRPRSVPGPIRRATAVARLSVDRLALYRSEMRERRGVDRLRYAGGKLAVVLRRIGQPAARDLQREISAREVYRSNVAALDRYRREPLHGELGMLAIMETARAGARPARDPDDWRRWWSGETIRVTVPGKDSGDMLSGGNAGHVAALMSAQLRAAFARNARPCADNAHESVPAA